MPTPDVIIAVYGGVVQAIYARPDTNIQLIDFDNLREGDPFDPEEFVPPDAEPEGPKAQATIAEALELVARHQRLQPEP